MSNEHESYTPAAGSGAAPEASPAGAGEPNPTEPAGPEETAAPAGSEILIEPGASIEPQAPAIEPAAIQILAAMANPVGPAPERETVLLLNASPQSVDLSGWRLADRLKHSCPLPPGPLAAGATLEVAAQEGVQLGNQGGAITVLDPQGLKVAGVSYTAAQAQREGWTIVF